jgi:type I restriction enzyme, S subunit
MLETKTQIQRYNTYKKSGVSWLDEVPGHWEIKRFKHIFKEKKIAHNVALNCGSISFGRVVYKNDEKVPVSTKKSYQVLNKGEFLINPLNLNYDLKSLRIGLSDKDVVVSSGYIIIQNHTELSKDYYKWLLHIFDIAFMKTLGSGVRQTLSFTHIANSELVFPPLSEQTEIAQFLDAKTTKIEEAIAIKEQQINLLKERKQILIHKAVTQGLNPNVKLKDSGVEWIGEIPEHWGLCKIKLLIEIKDGTHDTPDYVPPGINTYPLATSKHVTSGSLNLKGASHISLKDYLEIVKRSNVEIGDIIMPMIGTIGSPIIVELNNKFAIKNLALFKTSDSDKLSNRFLFYLIQSKFIMTQFDLISNGGVLGFMSLGQLRNLLIFNISIDEQIEIVDYLDNGTKKIETAISLKQQEIAKLKEYKSSLINGVVTGKVKVC